MKERPDVFVVVSGGGADAGFQALLSKTAEVTMAFRTATEQENQAAKDKGLRLVWHFFGWQGVAVFTNTKNPVQGLTMNQLRDIFTGRITSWKDVGGPAKAITVYTGDPARSDIYVFFKQYVLKGAQYSSKMVERRYTENLVKDVSSDETAIAFASRSTAERLRLKYSIKLIGMKQKDGAPPVLPSVKSVENRSYPLIQPLYLYRLEKCKKAVKDFIDYCMTHSFVAKAPSPKDDMRDLEVLAFEVAGAIRALP
jgi:phosphate transport system substrate-binding protein